MLGKLLHFEHIQLKKLGAFPRVVIIVEKLSAFPEFLQIDEFLPKYVDLLEIGDLQNEDVLLLVDLLGFLVDFAELLSDFVHE